MSVFNNKIFKSTLSTDEYIDSDHAIHYIKKRTYDESIFKELTNDIENIRIHIINWYQYNYSKLERYIVCKCKNIDTDELIFFIFDFYHYFLCSKELVNNNNDLKDLINIIDEYKIGEYEILENLKILDVDLIPKDYYNFEETDINIAKYRNLYLFKTIFKIQLESEFNHSFLDYRWFYVLNNIDPSACYNIDITSDNCKIFVTNIHFKFKTYYVSNPKKLFMNKIDPLPCKISRLSFDIECKQTGSFPDPKYMPISHICVECFYDDPKKNKILILTNCNLYEKNAKKNKKVYDMNECEKILNMNSSVIKIYTSEKNILIIFQCLLFHEFDYILSFNGHEFDIPYINTRMDIYNLLKLRMLNPFGFPNLNVIKGDASSRYTHIEYSSILFDLYVYTKKTYVLPEYKLETVCKTKFNINAIAELIENTNNVKIIPKDTKNKLKIFYSVIRTANYCFINDIAYQINKNDIIDNMQKLYDKDAINQSIGVPFIVKNCNITGNIVVALSKDDIDIGDKSTYENYTIEKANEIGNYCIHDTVLCNKLFETDLIHEVITGYSSQYLLPQNQVFNFTSSNTATGQLLYTLLQEKQMFKKYITEKDEYEGAYVFDPKVKKKYITEPIILEDYTSLYPTIMRQINASPEKIIKVITSNDNIMNAKIDNYIFNTYNYPEYMYIDITNSNKLTTFIITDCRKDGIIPLMLKQGMEKRSFYKKKMNDAKKANDDILYNVYNSMQYTTKIFINSIYGLMASETFMFNSKYCAQFCTALGRKCIKYTADILNNSYNINGIFTVNNVINIFTKTHIQTKYNSNIQECFTLEIVYGDTDSVFIIVHFKNKSLNDTYMLRLCKDIGIFISNTISNTGIFPKLFNLEFGGVKKWMLFIEKKKYISYDIINYDTLEAKIESKGTSLIKRDYSNFHKHHYKTIIEIIQKSIENKNNNSKNVVIKYIDELIKNLVDNLDKLNYMDFAVTKRYSGKYVSIDNIIELTVNKFNAKYPDYKIRKGDRFLYIYGIYMKPIDKSWNISYIKDISKKMIIIPSNLNNFNISEIRICIESYVIKLITDVSQLLDDKEITEKLSKYKKK
ncbi:DNA polymerase [Melanoplus sanguinipes entomopoxvirus]|uniref:DNA polymerase n=1 Tax=Melanoplus sanguinipes entomopoxvirus TaxID=83191 RepID=Q9YW56_MSEPV|nr:DNA polymerase [Melanoplus sanguinipes entomopoxvirus]AAC97837.1 ORF MSV036 putative DNA polymerase, Choristoneura biennis entomopox virus DPOL homolog (vaccinia E9L), similar to SW:P30319 [Melanoplus sanguinipes entomopoxvirus 'O']